MSEPEKKSARRAEKNPGGSPARKDRETGPEREARITARVREFSETLCEAEGLELVHVEYLRDRGGRVLRLYIDRVGGVTLDDCAHVSRQLGDWLDVSLDDIGPYSLEVSSPGPQRPIGKNADYERFAGRKAKISISPPRRGRKNFTGILKGLCDGKVALETAEGVVDISLAEIRKARLVDGE